MGRRVENLFPLGLVAANFREFPLGLLLTPGAVAMLAASARPAGVPASRMRRALEARRPVNRLANGAPLPSDPCLNTHMVKLDQYCWFLNNFLGGIDMGCRADVGMG